MEKITVKVRATARQAFSSGEVDKILGFAKGDTLQDSYPIFHYRSENE